MDRNKILKIAKKKNLTLYDDHPLVTRRDFLAAGIMDFAAFLAAPTILSSLVLQSREALAACDAGTANAAIAPIFIHYNITGGCALFNSVPRDQGGQLLGSYSKMGLGLQSTLSTKLADMFGVTGNFFDRDPAVNTGFAGGLQRRDVADAATRARLSSYQNLTSFIRFCVQSQDDSPNNRKRVLGLLAKTGKVGSNFPNLANQSIGQRAALNIEPPAGLTVSSVDDVLRATSPQGPFGDPAKLASADRINIIEAIMAMSKRHADSLMQRGLAGGPVLKENVDCATTANLDVAKLPAPTANPLQDTTQIGTDANGAAVTVAQAIGEIWNINANSNRGSRDFVFATLVYNTIKGNAAFCELQEGGGDYHDNTRTTGDTRDLGYGITIARIAQTAVALGRDIVIAVTTDGTVDSADSTSDTAPWASDQGTQAVDWLLLVKGTGGSRVQLVDRRGGPLANQVGYFVAGQAASRDWIPGWGVDKAAAAMFLNAMAFAGGAAGRDKALQIIGSTIPTNEVDLLLKLNV